MAIRGRGVLAAANLALVAAGLILCPATSSAAQAGPAAIAEQARSAMAERRFSDAAEHYGKLARSFPDQPELLANLGMALHLSGRDGAAVPALQRAASAMPSSFQAHFFLGASLTRLGQVAAAVAPLRQATALDPRHPFSKALLADALEETGEPAKAAEAWRALRDLDNRNPYPHAGLVRCYEELAAQAAERLRDLAPESAYMLRLLAHSQLDAGQYPSALYLFRQALDREPGIRSAHEAAAQVYARAGHAEWAASERESASRLPTTDCSGRQSPECVFAAGKFEAVAALSADSSPADLFWAARAYSKLAERAFGKLTALEQSLEQLTLLADLLRTQGKYSDAADACRRALAIRGGDGNLERLMAEMLYLARRVDEARPLLERFADSDASDPRWLSMLGNLLTEEQDFEAAVPLLEAALQLPDAPPSTRLDLGRSYVALGRPRDAVQHLEASLGTDGDGSVHYQLAQAYQRLGMREEAREALATYRELDTRNRQAIEEAASLAITPPQ